MKHERHRRLRLRRAARGASVLALAPACVGLSAGCGSGTHRPAQVTPSVASTAPPPSPQKAAHSSATRAARGYPETAEVRRLIALGRPIYCAPPHGREVALTFDDGPGPYTRLMLAKLRKHGAGATFFVVGRNIALIAGATAQERALGAVGDHTFTHPLLTTLGRQQVEAQIVGTQLALERASRGPVFLFRPPYGAHDATVDSIARAHGLLEILWNVDSRDSLGANYRQIERTVIAGLRPGAIILMHENHGQTIRAMIAVFAALARKHLQAVSVAQMLSDDPPSRAQVLAGGGGCGLSAAAKLSGG